MIEYVLDAAAEWQPIVVAGPRVSSYLHGRYGITVIQNNDAQRGMSYSLKLADAHLAPQVWLAVLLGDKPLVTPALIRLLSKAIGGVDVVYPAHSQSGVPGHPVFFGPRARAKMVTLQDGDTLAQLRDDPELRHRAVPTGDEGAFFDVDAL